MEAQVHSDLLYIQFIYHVASDNIKVILIAYQVADLEH
jgi:hypothetical protein